MNKTSADWGFDTPTLDFFSDLCGKSHVKIEILLDWLNGVPYQVKSGDFKNGDSGYLMKRVLEGVSAIQNECDEYQKQIDGIKKEMNHLLRADTSQ